MKTLKAIRCRKLITMAGAARVVGRDLFAPLPVMDDAVLISRGGVVVSVEPYAACRGRTGLEWTDMGEATICPAFINAHSHLQLAHLKGLTMLGQGFMPWLKSLVPLLRLALGKEALRDAIKAMVGGGTRFVADYTGPNLPEVAAIMAREGLDGLFLYECFGFDRQAMLNGEGLNIPAVFADFNCALAGHALYSTDEEILRAARAWCATKGKPFAIHLAESPEEVETLATGQGEMADFFRERVYPGGWKAPGLGPIQYAQKLNLLGAGTLAVHAVQCGPEDIDILTNSGTAICLCPRSNAAIGVGTAPVADFISAGTLLCLGTDSLASNYSLDIAEEALYLRDTYGLPPEALLRMLTVNAAHALGLGHLGSLEVGKSAAIASYPF